MNLTTDLSPLIQTVRRWIAEDPDPETRAEASALLTEAERGNIDAQQELAEAFDGRLAFGTAGLRGRLGAGPCRMNRSVVMQTSAGFAEFLLDRATEGETSTPPSVVIGYDGRVNSDVFARDAAEIMAGAGLRVTLLPERLPTPVTAFAVRHLGVSAGVMITASHNPPRDNGYKVYLGDADAGAQIAPPVDLEIADSIERAAALPLAELPRSTTYEVAGPEVLEAYVTQTAQSVREGLLAGDETQGGPELRVVYTAMHGVGSGPSQRVFELVGLPQVTPVLEQDQPDGAFPTVSFPNPEEPGALDLAFAAAARINADLVVAHDPDADRLAIAIPYPGKASGYRRLTGNELGLVLGWRAAERFRRTYPDAPGSLACTIVSSPALEAVAEDYGLGYFETLSGFKWVARVPDLVFGFEEALGYLTNPGIVRDKDGISASADVIALVRELAAEGRTIWDLLDEASERFGHFSSTQVTVRLDSMAATEELSNRVRTAPPRSFNGAVVERVTDLSVPGNSPVLANVLRYDLAGGSRVMIRPSGTEPKLKVYIDTFNDVGDAAERRASAERELARIEAAARSFLDRAHAEVTSP
ncbi:MAG: phospho-sugar mutase [Leucobacter sp.]